MPPQRLSKPIIAITTGDPGGVGPEVSVKALKRLARQPAYRQAYFLWIGPFSLLEYWLKRTKINLKVRILPYLDQAHLSLGTLHVLDTNEALAAVSIKADKQTRISIVANTWEKARVSERNAFIAMTSLQIAGHLAACGLVQAIATSPVNKQAMRLMDPKFIGHTEFLTRLSKTREAAMFFDGGPLKVTLVTIHLPLSKVSKAITSQVVKSKIKLTHNALKQYYGIRQPKVAVCALNPHGDEFGLEETKIITPAIKAMQKQGIKVTGPHPGDTVFHEAASGAYDAVVAMYHDQGLAPLKTVAFHEAVNVTLGLPFIRTSPDHGTAFDIAYKNRANESSMYRAISLALQLAKKR